GILLPVVGSRHTGRGAGAQRDCVTPPLRCLQAIRGGYAARGRCRGPSGSGAFGGNRTGRRRSRAARAARRGEPQAGPKPDPTLSGNGHRESKEGSRQPTVAPVAAVSTGAAGSHGRAGPRPPGGGRAANIGREL